MENSHCSEDGGLMAGDCIINGFVVMLMDMQERFIKKLRLKEADRIVLISKQLTILKLCRQFNIPVVVSEIRRDLHGATIKILMDEAEKNTQCHLISKESNNGFLGTGLDSYLKSIGGKKLFFFGINDYACIKHTAESSIKNGYEIMTSKDVISGPYYRVDDNIDQWFKSEGICFSFIEEFMKFIQSSKN